MKKVKKAFKNVLFALGIKHIGVKLSQVLAHNLNQNRILEYHCKNTFIDRIQQLKEYIQYLYEGLFVEIIFYENDDILGISLPDKISLKVSYTEPDVRCIQKCIQYQ